MCLHANLNIRTAAEPFKDPITGEILGHSLRVQMVCADCTHVFLWHPERVTISLDGTLCAFATDVLLKGPERVLAGIDAWLDTAGAQIYQPSIEEDA